jgi:hypothetical protein
MVRARRSYREPPFYNKRNITERASTKVLHRARLLR